MENYRTNAASQSFYRGRPAAQPVAPVVKTVGETLAGERFPVAMAYVPWQYWTETYPLEKALRTGTLFCQLDKPFLGRRVCK